MPSRLIVLLLAATLTWPAAPAQAESRTVRDSYTNETPALNVLRGTFTYTDSAAVFRVKFETITRRRTMLVTKYYRRDNVTLLVATKFVRGTKRVIVHRSDDTSFERLPARHVRARWNFDRDVITVRLTGPLLFGNRAGFHAWAQEKDAQHGGPGDELYVGGLRRG